MSKIDRFTLFQATIDAYAKSRSKPIAIQRRRWFRLAIDIGDAYYKGELSDREWDTLLSQLP